MSDRRTASRPAAGATRTGVASGLAALAASYVLSQTDSPELAAAAAAVVGGLLGWIGKLIRDKYPEIPTPF